ncbi:class I SAM-dependent methyltransferase [Cyanobium sp. ATX 6E8]|uniref:TylF/MycF/NovP-related O-methyltransferase n=1 Tax=Cyanobium sp. ATX 6E8 TaxID=2823701 RepID=UPI0020CF8D39|nr:class I SAM-dependent methyltransferase [Cyanobium sp. ATX 6E8]MCP9941923.1 class I SAM-dependent methyltransferase [Cyanobium sp. ATX 6E8]
MKHPLCAGDPKFEKNYGRDNLWVDRISLEWMHDPTFKRAYQHACADYTALYGAPQYEWRLHILVGLASAASRLHPDSCFVDLGVHEANYAACIREYFGSLPVAHHYLYDSWEGLSDMAHEDEKCVVGSTYADPEIYRRVIRKFSNTNNYTIVRGWLPEALNGDFPRFPISLLSVDLNSAKPEVSCLELLWKLVVGGGYILLDDYGRNPRQRLAVDDFARAREQFVFTLPTGQGLIIKS